jgi:hypothetical protein
MTAYRLAGEALDLVAAYENDLWDIGQLPDSQGAVGRSLVPGARR